MEKEFPGIMLKKADVVLKTYTNERMTVVGELLIQVAYEQQCEHLPIVIVAGDRPSLLGRNWLKQICLDWNSICTVARADAEEGSLKSLLCEHEEIFKDELGTVCSLQATLHVRLDARPKFFKPLHPWVWPSRPWQRIHVDFAGPFLGKSFLVVVDAHSKWPEVFEMSSTTALKTIATLRHLFAAYGLLEQLVSNNGPQFTSEEFQIFVKQNGVKHIRCAPYHPSSNGAAERFVQTFKQVMKAQGGWHRGGRGGHGRPTF